MARVGRRAREARTYTQALHVNDGRAPPASAIVNKAKTMPADGLRCRADQPDGRQLYHGELAGDTALTGTRYLRPHRDYLMYVKEIDDFLEQLYQQFGICAGFTPERQGPARTGGSDVGETRHKTPNSLGETKLSCGPPGRDHDVRGVGQKLVP